MKTFAKTLLIGVLLTTSAVHAETEATTPEVKARQELMKSFGGAAKALGGMAGGDVAFDAAAAEAAKAALVDGAAKIATVFEQAGSDPASEAKPEIWTNWEDFLVKAKGLGDAAAALDATTLEGVQAGMGGVGGACKACHTAYRM